MGHNPIYTMVNHIFPPTHSYKLAQSISIKEECNYLPIINTCITI